MLLRTLVRRTRPCHRYARTFSVTLNRWNITADAHTRGSAWREATSRSITVRTWDTVTLNMIDIFSIIREIERRFGKIQSFEAKRSADVESEYLKYMFIVFQHRESKAAITAGQVIQVKSPRFDTVDNENMSLEHLAWALDPVIRDEFLHGRVALPGEKDAVLQTTGLPETTPDGSPVEYHVIDIKLEDGYPTTDHRYDQKLSTRRRQELAQALVSFGGFVDRPIVDGVLGRRAMDAVLEHWTTQLSPQDRAELQRSGGVDPSGAASVEDTPSSSGGVSKSPSSRELQDFWFPQASREESELLRLSLEPAPLFKSYAPPDPSAIFAEAATPVQPDPRPPPPKSNPSSQSSKKERLLMAARKAAEAAALKEMQNSVIAPVSSNDSVEIEEIIQAQSSGEVSSIASEVPHLEMQENAKGNAVPRNEPLQRQRSDIPAGSVHADREPNRPSARSWLKTWIG